VKKIIHHSNETISLTWYEDNDEKGNEALLILIKSEIINSVILNKNQTERLFEILNRRKEVILERFNRK
jgi:hypothetical protein